MFTSFIPLQQWKKAFIIEFFIFQIKQLELFIQSYEIAADKKPIKFDEFYIAGGNINYFFDAFKVRIIQFNVSFIKFTYLYWWNYYE